MWTVQLFDASTKANQEYLDASSAKITASTAAKQAKDALEYATNQFETYTSVVVNAQKEVDETIPKLTAEKNELNDEKPILSQLRTMIDGLVPQGSTKGQAQFLKALPTIKQMASAIYAPKLAQKAIGKQVQALHQSLASDTTTNFDTANSESLLAIIDTIVAGMDTRIGEIDRTVARVNGDLAAANAKKSEDQAKLVALAEAKAEGDAQEAAKGMLHAPNHRAL